MSEKLKLRSVRVSDELWSKILLAAEDVGTSASAYLVGLAERSLGGAERPQELRGAPGAPAAPRPAANAASAPALLPWRPVRASDEPRALEPIDQCSHPAAARRGGVGVVRHCAACGQPFGLTGIAG